MRPDRVLVTVPDKILQGDTITFDPAFPASKSRAIDDVYVPAGIGVFIEFGEKFYPDLTLVGGSGPAARPTMLLSDSPHWARARVATVIERVTVYRLFVVLMVSSTGCGALAPQPVRETLARTMPTLGMQRQPGRPLRFRTSQEQP